MGASATVKYHYGLSYFTYSVIQSPEYSGSRFKGALCALDLCGRQSQVGSLAGAAHLLKDNTGVLR